MKRKASEGALDLSSFLPNSFGKRAKTDGPDSQLNSALDKTRKKKVIPQEAKPRSVGADLPEPVYVYGVNMPPEKKDAADEEDLREYDEVDMDNPFGIPYSHEVELKGHDGHVSALALDPKGARLVTGGYDSMIRLWDFNAMDERLKSFRTVEPPTDIISTINYNTTGSQFVIASNSPQARIFDRDGKELVEFPKGYPYVLNMAETKGHVSRVTSAFFHPKNKQNVITSSQDCTIRIWDVNSIKKHKEIIKVKNAQGAVKSPVMKCAINQDGSLLAAVCQDGSLQFFPFNGPYTKHSARFENAHQFGSEASSLVFSSDGMEILVAQCTHLIGNTLLSRGGDDSLKVWDVRALAKGPLKAFDNLPNKYAETGIAFSPDEKLFVTGTSTTREATDVGKLVFFDRETLTEHKSVALTAGSVLGVVWHKELNQILCGCTDRAVHVLYNPEVSSKGVMLCLSKHAKKVRAEDSVVNLNIQNPHSLPMFKAPTSARRAREKARSDPTKACLPQPPQIGPGSGGRVGQSLTASLMKDLVAKTPFENDPRAALMKYHRDTDITDQTPITLLPVEEPKKKDEKKFGRMHETD